MELGGKTQKGRITEQIKTTERNGTDGNSYRTHGNGWEQAGMSREGRRTIGKVRENTVYDSLIIEDNQEYIYSITERDTGMFNFGTFLLNHLLLN